ncbi:MAG: carbohydrate-binding family 9-like protein [Acidobacteriota bacterium]|nr:carbohydrate-binding family 9-like protein [Acidobacteriota bacterium]
MLLWLCLLPTAFGDQPFPTPKTPFAPRHYVCYRASAPLKMDGRLDEADWKAAEPTQPFADIEGPSKPAPPLLTRARMLWDDQYLYIGAQLHEPHVWAKLTERDSVIYYDDDFEVFIDPDGDTHNYYELEINALGTEWDLFLTKPYRDDGKAIDAWDITGLKTAVWIDGTLNNPADIDKGWSVEIAIPWKVLKQAADKPTPPGNGDRWRMGFSRVDWRMEVVEGTYRKVVNPKTGKPYPENNWVWSPPGLISMHYPERWGYVQFSSVTVGRGKVAFEPEPEADGIRVLYRIYYAQREYQRRHGRFTDDLKALGLESEKARGYLLPKLEIGISGFNALLEPQGNLPRLTISTDGHLQRFPAAGAR